MPRVDTNVGAHREWLGFVQQTGLVVSVTALACADVILNRRDVEGQRLLRECLEIENSEMLGGGGYLECHEIYQIFQKIARTVLGWNFSPLGFAGTSKEPIPEDLAVDLPGSSEVFRPDFAVRAEPRRSARPVGLMRPGKLGAFGAVGSTSGSPSQIQASQSQVTTTAGTTTGGKSGEPSPWQLLVSLLDSGQSLDRASNGTDLSAHGRMERLLRATRVPAGLLFNGKTLRLISAPPGESSGWLDFNLSDMVQTAGRPICSAFRELLGQTRLLAVPTDERLAALLLDSRRFQNEVSERLAQQVLHGLYELLRGFQAADDQTRGELLRRQLVDAPEEIYRGLLTVVLRLVFLLYAEERDLLPQSEAFLSAYSVTGLYERLRSDASQFPDTMDQRYGAYAQLLALWRMVHDGARGPDMRLTARHGDLFRPDSYPFLEGRGGVHGDTRQRTDRIDPPLVPDGTIYRLLEKLIVLDGERISYRALDVEHIGSVYETMMGFRVEWARGRSVAIKAAKKHGAPATINLEEFAAEPPGKRPRWFRDHTDRSLTPKVSKAVRAVGTDSQDVDEMHAALESVVDKQATPDIVPEGAMVLQPTEARRRTGSHYTPRELTEPIVRIALEPIFDRLREEGGGSVTPEQILDLKVCDPAMGSGAFLVEACRQLSAALVEAWQIHGVSDDVPKGDRENVALRLIAHRCLYGVDINEKAVDLAKLSLWLTTLEKDQPFTFLDHALRRGDSLVGLSTRQLQAFHWKGNAKIFQPGIEAIEGRKHIDEAVLCRELIRQADESYTERELRFIWDEAETATEKVRLLGDLVCLAFFQGTKAKQRESVRLEYANKFVPGDTQLLEAELRDRRDAQERPLVPFHWPIEFPEVFDREDPGFDTVVGNPPFLGGRNVTATLGKTYSDWLRQMHIETTGGADLVAHFFRRSFDLLRNRGTFGLIATHTIAKGDTRASGLRWICRNKGVIYHARKRVPWSGQAAVIVSTINVAKGEFHGTCTIDENLVSQITAFLHNRGGHQDPFRLSINRKICFQGTILLGMGFTFDDYGKEGVTTPLAKMKEIISSRPDSRAAILPYIGGDELNSSPTHSHTRYAINFGERSESYCRKRWPELFSIIEERVKPDRIKKNAVKYPRMVNEWWKYFMPRSDLYEAITGSDRALVISCHTHHVAFAFLPSEMVFSNALNVVAVESYSGFCVLQSTIHEVWARFFGSSLGSVLRYTTSDVFQTYPFLRDWTINSNLERPGKRYYNCRAELMIRNGEGMTKTYNRFHDPYESSFEIEELRRLHSKMDRAVLDAYGWTDIPTDCEFLLDYAIDEETWSSRKKKPYRYRWPDEVRDEVLARLLELNAERAAEEERAGLTARPKYKQKSTNRSRTQAQANLWDWSV